MKKKLTKAQEINQEIGYIAFLEKRLGSKNFHNNVTVEEVEKTKEKLKKARFRLRLLEGKV